MIRQPQQVAFFNVVIKIKKGQSFQTGLNYKLISYLQLQSFVRFKYNQIRLQTPLRVMVDNCIVNRQRLEISVGN